MILNITNVSKSYQQGKIKIEVLKNINLSIEAGTTLAIQGSSGSGKTTLLSLMSGLDQPDIGDIEINKTYINQISESELSLFRGKNIGIVFQQYHLMSHLTALENVCLPLEILNEKNPESKALDFLDLVGLKNRANHLPHELSGGECQRVAIARAFVAKPKIIFADEPSGNLDNKTGKQIMDLLFSLIKKHHMTMVLVTHDQNLADQCERKVILYEGQIQ